MKITKLTAKTTLLAFATLLITQSAHAGGGSLFLPSVSSNRAVVQDVTTLDELKACVKDPKSSDACQITNAMLTARKKAGVADTVKFSYRDRSNHTDQAIFLRFKLNDDYSCDIGWHVQRDFWWSECKGPAYGDGGTDTIYIVPVLLDSVAHRFVLAIGSEAGVGRAGNIITYSVNEGFWIVDWRGQAHDGLCPVDNPYTEAREDLCR